MPRPLRRPATLAEAEPGLRELYSHEGQASFPVDFDSYENANVALQPEYAAQVRTADAPPRPFILYVFYQSIVHQSIFC